MRILELFCLCHISFLFAIYYHHHVFIPVTKLYFLVFSALEILDIWYINNNIRLHCIVPYSLKCAFMYLLSFSLHNDPGEKVGSLLSLFYRWENGGSERLVLFYITLSVMWGRARNWSEVPSFSPFYIMPCCTQPNKIKLHLA